MEGDDGSGHLGGAGLAVEAGGLLPGVAGKAVATCRELVRSMRAMARWRRVWALMWAVSAHDSRDWTRWKRVSSLLLVMPRRGARCGAGVEDRVGAVGGAPGEG